MTTNPATGDSKNLSVQSLKLLAPQLPILNDRFLQITSDAYPSIISSRLLITHLHSPFVLPYHSDRNNVSSIIHSLRLRKIRLRNPKSAFKDFHPQHSRRAHPSHEAKSRKDHRSTRSGAYGTAAEKESG